jgi:AraC-like DNA-binding protein
VGEPPDFRLLRPWCEPIVFGVRRDYVWGPAHLARLRTHFWHAYWNPTPGAAVMAESGRIALGPGRLLLIPAGAWFQRENLRPFDHWWAHVRVASRPESSAPMLIPVVGELAALLTRSWQLAWQCGPAAVVSQAVGHAVLALALAQVSWQDGGAETDDPRLASLVRWLQDGDYPRLSNSALADRVGMHPKAFCRSFHLALGEAPQDWLRARRLDLAAERLGQGLSVEAVAELGGFADRFHFGRLFRRHRGIGPGQYRKVHATDPVA